METIRQRTLAGDRNRVHPDIYLVFRECVAIIWAKKETTCETLNAGTSI